MAELNQAPINFPWDLFMEAQRLKNKNQQDMYGNIAGIGQGLGTIGQNIENQQAQSTVAQAIEAMRTGKLPMQGPQLPGVGLGPGQTPPTSGMGAPTPPPQMPPGLTKALVTLNPKFGTDQFDALRQSEVFKNYAAGNKDISKNTENMVDVFRGPDGKMSTSSKAGYTKIGQVPLKEAYQYDAAGQLANTKAGIKSQADLKTEWNIIAKSVNPFSPVGMSAASTIFSKAANGNRAIASGVKLLQKASLTWKEVNAYVNSDFANLQRGGAPTDLQLSEANYHTALSMIGKIKEYITSQPATGLVTLGARIQMMENFKELQNVDNQIIDDALDYQVSAHPDAIAAFPSRWENTRKSAEKVKSLVDFEKPLPSFGSNAPSKNSRLSVSGFSVTP